MALFSPHQKSSVSPFIPSPALDLLKLTCICLLAVIDRSALAISRSANPNVFEEKLRENQRNDPKFSFLNPADPYHAYYRDRLDRIQAGEIDTDAAVPEIPKEQANAIESSGVIQEEYLEPPPHEFVFDIPSISPLDM
jgi:splicing factor 3A subunit 1